MKDSNSTSCSCNKHSRKKNKLFKNGKKVSILNFLSGVLLFIFPKCPLCWAAYGSILSFLGLGQIKYNSNWRYMILLVFLVGSFMLISKYYTNKSWYSIFFYGLGMSLLIISFFLNLDNIWLKILVLFLIILSNFSASNIRSRFI